MERHSSTAIFISEIPVRCTGNGEKIIKWVNNLSSSTTARDVIISTLPTCDPIKYSLYIHIDRKKQILKDSTRIYKVVAKLNQRKSSRPLLFEIQLKKRVRFADEIIIQTIIQGQSISHERITKSIPIEKRLESLKENFQKYTSQQQENYMKLSSNLKRSSLSIINENISFSSSESGISSSSSTNDFIKPTKLETLV
ncbi:unnamed protein product [Adineta steineri]|uniref:Uncharacterized protein n=1 Tax=Adineta steineri TaxID=433720 RepID=A0A815G1H9_9BILA|nr:unnamed protein product [Adineta steineri]CAF1589873.1 unnamed protein product [Adineta steineri]